MPSASPVQWRNDRVPRLAEVEAQCAASVAVVPALCQIRIGVAWTFMRPLTSPCVRPHAPLPYPYSPAADGAEG
jgi:hypothetical protein